MFEEIKLPIDEVDRKHLKILVERNSKPMASIKIFSFCSLLMVAGFWGLYFFDILPMNIVRIGSILSGIAALFGLYLFLAISKGGEFYQKLLESGQKRGVRGVISSKLPPDPEKANSFPKIYFTPSRYIEVSQELFDSYEEGDSVIASYALFGEFKFLDQQANLFVDRIDKWEVES
ncbi:MAG: hypothetical protein MRZ79_19035 [Bacteroidia bacterium]|nr:hypothetical protein [Bacteroidia bacterium]